MDKSVALSLYREAMSMRAEVETIDPEAGAKLGHGTGISAFLGPFNGLLLRAQAALAGVSPAVSSLGEMIQPLSFDEHLAGATSHRKLEITLMLGLGRVIALVEPFLTEGSAPATMRATREGIFFGGEYYEPLRLAAGLIAQAKRSIAIIDGYLGDGLTILNLLAGKGPGVDVSLLTYEDKLESPLLALALAFHKQHGGLSLRASRAFHDRFIIIDDTDFYHFGGSLKDMGKRGFMFSRIEEPDVIEKIRTKFVEEREKATVKI